MGLLLGLFADGFWIAGRLDAEAAFSLVLCVMLWAVQGETTVIVRDCQLLCGILDKAQSGNAAGGLVHSIYEVG